MALKIFLVVVNQLRSATMSVRSGMGANLFDDECSVRVWAPNAILVPFTTTCLLCRKCKANAPLPPTESAFFGKPPWSPAVRFDYENL